MSSARYLCRWRTARVERRCRDAQRGSRWTLAASETVTRRACARSAVRRSEASPVCPGRQEPPCNGCSALVDHPVPVQIDSGVRICHELRRTPVNSLTDPGVREWISVPFRVTCATGTTNRTYLTQFPPTKSLCRSDDKPKQNLGDVRVR